jgi:hypothetical protein
MQPLPPRGVRGSASDVEKLIVALQRCDCFGCGKIKCFSNLGAAVAGRVLHPSGRRRGRDRRVDWRVHRLIVFRCLFY